ncbi:MAG: Secretion protein HlyD family protein [Desulfotomaculum sp. 46_296]|nr:MAG: Secretion protein HlyD family protein [Desulfotomaculum sp. 46_296]KUK84809.1 MAG: Secretion protein HlyD family protein [Desulfofundulus kuznetsovii]HAU32531.1 hypothetical protein [Desulfotomaculum sp.]
MEEQNPSTGPVANRNNSKLKMISFAVVAIIVLGIAAGAFLWWRDLRISVSTDDAQVSGDIINISPAIAGRLDKIYVKEGDVVKAGQTVAELDNDQYYIALAQAEANLNLAKANYAKLPYDIRSAQAALDKAQQGLLAAQAQVKSAELGCNDAKRFLDQYQSLYSSGAASKEQLDTAQSRFGVAQASLEAAKAGFVSAQESLKDANVKLEALNNTGAGVYLAQQKQAQAAYDNARLTYNNSIIHSTKNGTVIRVSAKEGENLAPYQTILTICDLSSTWVIANIEEKKFNRIHLGQTVDINIDAYPGKDFKGEVIELGGATQATFSLIPTQNYSGNFTKVTQRLPVKIKLNKGDQVLKPGMSAEVKIHTA